MLLSLALAIILSLLATVCGAIATIILTLDGRWGGGVYKYAKWLIILSLVTTAIAAIMGGIYRWSNV
jgi:hypothetical protein